MIRVTVEIIPFGVEENRKELGRIELANDGSTGMLRKGNYNLRAYRKGTKYVQREGRVENHSRQSLSIWTLVRKALQAMNY